MRGIRSAVVGVAVVGVLASTGVAAQAEPVEPTGTGSRATCHFEGDLSLDPGVTPEVTTTKYASIGEASLYCTEGSAYGSPVLPDTAGTYREWGSSTGDCSEGRGTGEYEAYIATQAGMKRVTGEFQLWYSGGGGFESDSLGKFNAEFTFTPKAGTCTVDDPLVAVHLKQHVTFTS